MVHTGWAGGHYWTGSRLKLANTQAMVYAALTNKLDNYVDNNQQKLEIILKWWF